jgi:hypothetical protein
MVDACRVGKMPVSVYLLNRNRSRRNPSKFSNQDFLQLEEFEID